MGSRNKQRPTFEKRQREIARQERQAEKRARRRARAEGLDEDQRDPEAPVYDADGFPIDASAVPTDDQTITPGIS
ncbi:MAG: hypothetical protein WD598_06365 [Acidimicrobiia bacterium]